MPKGVESRASTMENPNGVKGNGGRTNAGAKGSAFTDLKAGDSKSLLDIGTAGIVQRIWVTIDDRSPEMLRSLRLRMYWDGAAKPAVDVPFGDFFCAALGQPVAFQSAFFSNPEGLIAYIAKHPVGARVRPDMKVVFFDEWEKPKARLKGAAGILRALTALAEKGKKAA